ncbi:MAG: transposase [Deltaproteobacteria bacterium]|nr:transposase [Deltaproteobacteria bacterium]
MPKNEKEFVAQPPSAVQAKPAKDYYKRNLPHYQVEGRPIFITFNTYQRWELPESIRHLVIKHCLYDHGKKILLHGIVVMSDHVHMILTPLNDKEGRPFGLAEIMNGIKGASAHSINKALGRKGHVWQDESFDHILRSDVSIMSKVEYICENPVRKGMTKKGCNNHKLYGTEY